MRRGHRHHLRPISEAEAYARCHGMRFDDVRIVKLEPRRPRYQTSVSGENLREAFEQRLNSRDPLDETEAGAPLEGDADSLFDLDLESEGSTGDAPKDSKEAATTTSDAGNDLEQADPGLAVVTPDDELETQSGD